MISFLIKGLIRDKNRSLAPVAMIAAGVALAVLMGAWIRGSKSGYIDVNARLDTGHVKILTQKAAAENQEQAVDLALLGTGELLEDLRQSYPELSWQRRIRFAGLIDRPGPGGETAAQGPVSALAVDLLGSDEELKRLKLKNALAQGRLPQAPGELLVSYDLAQALGLQLGSEAALLTADLNGSMAVENFTVVGWVRFGVAAMDRGMVLLDVSDAARLLYLDNGATEILGFYQDGRYRSDSARALAQQFNAQQAKDPFSPHMWSLEDQNGLGNLLSTVGAAQSLINVVLLLIMSVVLWNSGLMNGIRRFGEMGLRLAIGETKTHLYWSLLIEALVVGLVGWMLGTALGLVPAWYLQEYGLNIQEMMSGETAMMLSNEIHGQIDAGVVLFSLIPGLLAPLLGVAVAGLGVFRRDTSQLFKELEING